MHYKRLTRKFGVYPFLQSQGMKTEERTIPCRPRRLRHSAMGERKAPAFGSAGEEWRVYRSGFVIPTGWGSAAATGSGPLRSLHASFAVGRSGLRAFARRGISARQAEPVPASFAISGGRASERGSDRCDGHCLLPEDASPSTAGSRSAHWPYDMADASKNQNQ